MKILESIQTVAPIVPAGLNITQISTCELEEKEFNGSQVALLLLNEYRQIKPIPQQAKCTLVYTHLDSITVHNDGKVLGSSPYLAILYLSQIRQRPKFRWMHMMVAVLEELCHSLYHEPNEYAVKRLVRDIVVQEYRTSLHAIYPAVFDAEDRPILLPEYKDDYYEFLSR